MTFMLVGADDFGIDRHMVSYQSVTTHAFLQAKIFWRVPSVDGVNLSFHSLTITARVYCILNIEEVKCR